MKAAHLFSLAWRESRFARRRLLLFLSAITLGVAALVAVQGFAANLAAGVREQARAMLGADLVLSSRQPFGPDTQALLDSLRAAEVPVARVTSFASMALLPESGATRLVQVRAPEPGFPFYGEIETRPAGRWGELHAGGGALVDPALLIALEAQVGDTLALGQARFPIRGVLEEVPGDVEIASAFAPRVFIPAASVASTGLIGFGSRVEHDAYLRLPAPGAAQRLAEEYGPVLEPERVRMRTAQEQREGLEEALGRLADYLGLVGVFALLLGGIGVASAMGAYMARKTDTVAVLRCLGATAGQVFSIYLLQAAVMGLAGASLGVVLGAAVQWVLPQLLDGLLPVDVEVALDGGVVLMGVGVGVGTALVFALLPLLQVRRVSPLGALRRRVEPVRTASGDRAQWAAWALLGGGVIGLLVFQAGSVRVGAGLAAGIAATLGLLWLVVTAATGAVRRLALDTRSYPVRQGLANLHRPGNQTRVVVLALGFGVFLLATLLLVQHNLLRPLRTEDAAERANLLLWDVQQDQSGGVAALLREQGLPVLQEAPIVTMRVAAINGAPVRLGADDADADADREEAPEGWALRREYRSTYRDSFVGSEDLVAGTWWAGGADRPRQVSLEQEIAGDLGVGLGDTITWDVQGVRVPTVVTSLREVDWTRFEPNFFAVFPTEVLAGAPHTWVLLTRGDTPEERIRAQQAIVRRYPNVAALDLTHVQEALDAVVGRVSAAIRFLAAFSLVTGLVVLIGAVSASRLQRIRESVLLKALGATRRQIGAILFTEYLTLGSLAVLSGLLLALGAGWALSRWLFEVDFAVPALPLAVLGAVVTALSVGVGWWGSREVFRHTPLEAIREE